MRSGEVSQGPGNQRSLRHRGSQPGAALTTGGDLPTLPKASLWPGLTRSAGTEGPGVCLPTGHTGSRGGTQAPCPPPPPHLLAAGDNGSSGLRPQERWVVQSLGNTQRWTERTRDSPGAGSARGTWPDGSGLGAWGPGQWLGPGQGRPGSPPARSPSASWRRSGPAPGSPWTRRHSPDSSTPGPRPLCQGGKLSPHLHAPPPGLPASHLPGRPSPRVQVVRPSLTGGGEDGGGGPGVGSPPGVDWGGWTLSATRVPGVACSPPSGRQGSHS